MVFVQKIKSEKKKRKKIKSEKLTKPKAGSQYDQ